MKNAKATFKAHLGDSKQKLNSMRKKLGSSVDKAKSYYDLRLKAKEVSSLLVPKEFRLTDTIIAMGYLPMTMLCSHQSFITLTYYGQCYLAVSKQFLHG